MNTEIMLPEPITTAIQKSGISDVGKAEKIAANYAPIMNLVTEQINIVKTLEKGKAEDVEKARRARIDLGKIASAAEKQKAADKQTLLIETRFIDALYNTVAGAARITQDEAKSIEEHFERLEAAKKAKIQEEREAEIQPYLHEGSVAQDYASMADDVWGHFLKGTKDAYQARIDAAAKAETERIAKEKAEAEERERIRLENERLKAEAEAKQKEIEEANRKIEEERKKQEQIRAEERRKAEEEAARIRKEEEKRIAEERAARERAEAELRQKAEEERKKQAESERVERERIASEKKAAKAPDKEKIMAALNSMAMPSLQFKTTESAEFYAEICNDFHAFIEQSVERTKSL